MKTDIQNVINGTHFFIRTGNYGTTLIIKPIQNEYKGYSTYNHSFGFGLLDSLHIAKIDIGIDIMPNTDVNKHLGKITIDNYKQFIDIACKYENKQNQLIGTTDIFSKFSPDCNINQIPTINDKEILQKYYDFEYNGGTLSKNDIWIKDYFDEFNK
jgi:hypothetical protein